MLDEYQEILDQLNLEYDEEQEELNEKKAMREEDVDKLVAEYHLLDVALPRSYEMTLLTVYALLGDAKEIIKGIGIAYKYGYKKGLEVQDHE